ncbi:MAG: HIT family protein [Lachnospiraceae bacterium]|nr:HIT family protein [Lachnospiraceae bacterium]
MTDCIFCKIANGEIPAASIYEDEDFNVILDLGPVRRGHALILPKKHYADLFEIPEDLSFRALRVAKKVGAALMKGLSADGLQLTQNNGEAAGQTIFHYHLHLIPGYKELGPVEAPKPGVLEEEDKIKIPELVKQYL